MKTSVSSHVRMLALACTLFVSACDAQKTSFEASALAKGQRYAEPALLGRVIDMETKQPIKGAFVYGHYATSTGTLAGGTKFGELVKSFSAETDDNGYFKLDAWDTGSRLIQGERRGKFPSVSVYKPGYTLSIQGVNSISEWRSVSSVNAARPKVVDNVIDWREFPYELKPVRTEFDRYMELTGSDRSVMFDGECGWETYTKLIVAQHNELKDWYRRNLPASELAADGYPKPNAQIPQQFRAFSMIFNTTADQLLKQQRVATRWGCNALPAIFKELK